MQSLVNTAIKVLIVEDSEDDTKLVLRALRHGGFDPAYRRVQTAEELTTELANDRWDAVISDFRMPGFTGMDALRIFRSAGVDIPFILISGTMGEETAVDAMKGGASDYVMKQSLARLAPALERERNESLVRAAHRVAQRSLIESEERFRGLTALSSDWYWEQDENFRFTQVSAGLKGGFGAVVEGWIGKTRWELPHRDADWTELRAVLAARKPFRDVELQPIDRDGSVVHMSISGEPRFDDAGDFSGYRGVGKDITARRVAEIRLGRLNRVYAVLSGINGLIVRVRDRAELFREACRIAVEDGGFHMTWIGTVDRNEMKILPVASAGADDGLLEQVGERLSLRDDAPDGHAIAAMAVREMSAIVVNDVAADARIHCSNAHAERRQGSCVSLPLLIADQAIAVMSLHASEAGYFDEAEMNLLTELAGDIAYAIDHIEKQERLDYLAYYDLLTGLANRTLFLERVAQYMRSAVSGGHKVAVFMIDLERFKNINDSLGQLAGDALLRQVAEWLTRDAGDASFLARVGSDHFAAVLPEVREGGDVARLLEKSMRAFLGYPFRVDDAVFHIAAKVGVAIFPDDGTDTESLFNHAEAALKKAKATGDRYLFYTQKMTTAMAGKLTMENQLRQALEKHEFVLHYQPKVNLQSGRLTGAEALIRWDDPRTGLVPPGRFISVLEETGLIHDVGRWAMRQAIDDCLRWRAAGLTDFRVAVNVSPLQLRHPGFIADVRRAIGRDAFAAAALELELTESLVMADVRHSVVSLRAIRAMGVSIAIDDFGTGFSSLSYLAKLPVDSLKIDRSFVIAMKAAPEGLALVSTIINLAHSLKLNVVAEGVETEEQSRLLRLLSCNEMQGYLFSKPLPVDVFETRYLAALHVA
jgi:diguanylate cyclase (GGDEF)-like protein/PAS domain S-box-containing protein